MKHTVNLADTSFTVELGPQTLMVLNSISWQLKRLADSWEGVKKEDDSVKAQDVNTKRSYRPRKTGDIGARTIMTRLGMPNNAGLFRAACSLAKVKPFTHNKDDFHLFIKAEDADRVIEYLKKFNQ